jgi:hypothetical protein
MAWVAAIAPIVDSLAARNGRYNERVPKMRPSDMVALVGIFSQSLPTAIDRIAGKVTRSDFVSSDGLFSPPASLALMATMDMISSADYVFRSVPPSSSAFWRRTPSSLTDAQRNKARLAGIAGAPTYEPARDGSVVRNDQLELVTFLRQTITDYQRAIDAAGQAIALYPMNQIASVDLCTMVLRAVRELAADLEVLAENPPTTLSSDVKGAFGVALKASEKATVELANAAGDAAAHAANLAGEVAAAAAGGFLNAANLATLAVTLAVGYVALRRYG